MQSLAKRSYAAASCGMLLLAHVDTGGRGKYCIGENEREMLHASRGSTPRRFLRDRSQSQALNRRSVSAGLNDGTILQPPPMCPKRRNCTTNHKFTQVHNSKAQLRTIRIPLGLVGQRPLGVGHGVQAFGAQNGRTAAGSIWRTGGKRRNPGENGAFGGAAEVPTAVTVADTTSSQYSTKAKPS